MTFICTLISINEGNHRSREVRLSWFGRVQRGDAEYIGRRMLKVELAGKRKRRRPTRRVMDVVREDMEVDGMTERRRRGRPTWRWK